MNIKYLRSDQTNQRDQIQKKYEELLHRLKSLEKVVVALSGGVDSALLAYAAKEALGEGAQALTVVPPYIHTEEVKAAEQTAEYLKINHHVLQVDFPEEIVLNPRDRCYHCKTKLFKAMKIFLEQEGLTNSWRIIEGTNADDVDLYRPGRRALEELKIISPLLECGLTKDDIRSLAKEKKLLVWNKPANACLLTRFPYATAINLDTLKKTEQAEKILSAFGFNKYKVRVHDDLIRIEMEPQKAQEIWQEEVRCSILHKFKALGFKFVTIDLEEIRSGCFD